VRSFFFVDNSKYTHYNRKSPVLKNESDNKNGALKGKADYTIETIAQLYMIEKKAIDLSINERYKCD
jgi:hypothetical protein